MKKIYLLLLINIYVIWCQEGTIVDKGEIQDVAKIGTIEDSGAVLDILPYSISNSENLEYTNGFSVRGSDPDDLKIVIDGIEVDNFYHSDNISILSPNILESVKLSSGIFSVKNSQSSGGLLEVTTLSPDFIPQMKISSNFSSVETLFELPIGSNSNFGILGGSRVYNPYILEPTILSDDIHSDFFIKSVYSPNNSLRLFVNGYGFYDDLGAMEESRYIVSTGLNSSLSDNLSLDFIFGYEYGDKNRQVLREVDVTSYYPDYLAEPCYVPFQDMKEETYVHNLQSRIDLQWSITTRVKIQTGLGVNYNICSLGTSGFDHELVTNEIGEKEYKREDFDNVESKETILNSFLYLNSGFEIVKDLLSTEIGCRADSYYTNERTEFDPRISFSLTPKSNNFLFSNNEIYIGSGLFTNNSLEKSFMSLLGCKSDIPLGLDLKLEGYYKYLYNRNYGREYSDGYGHVLGGDIMLKKKISRYVYGILNYSYVNSNYNNPKEHISDTLYTYPVGENFSPIYHRYHNINLLVNLQPSKGCAITTSLGVFSGVPEIISEEESVLFSYTDSDGDENSTKLRSSSFIFENSNRSAIQFPLDVKVSFFNHFPDSKKEWNCYVGIEDLLGLFYEKYKIFPSLSLGFTLAL